jgi:hypothetical protein
MDKFNIRNRGVWVACDICSKQIQSTSIVFISTFACTRSAESRRRLRSNLPQPIHQRKAQRRAGQWPTLARVVAGFVRSVAPHIAPCARRLRLKIEPDRWNPVADIRRDPSDAYTIGMFPSLSFFPFINIICLQNQVNQRSDNSGTWLLFGLCAGTSATNRLA